MKIKFPCYEILSLFNDTKIPDLHHSGIQVSLKIPS